MADDDNGPWNDYSAPVAAPPSATDSGPWNDYAAPSQPQDTGYFAPERKVWGMMQNDPMGTAGKLIGAGAGAVYNAGKSALTGDWFAPLAHQTGAETAANTATPQTAGQVANVAGLTATGDMVAPGLPGAARTFTRAPVERPSPEELHELAGQQADAARDMGVDYSIPHIADLSSGLEQQLYNQGRLPTDAPRTYAKLAAMRSPPAGAVSVPISGLEGMRRGFSELTADKSVSPAERAAAATAFGGVHDFMVDPPPEAVLAGPAAEAGQLLATSKANHAAAYNADRINNNDIAAEDRAAGANSGRNYDNTVRQNLRPIIDPRQPANAAGYNDTEIQNIRNVVRGYDAPKRNFLRKVGNMGGGGHGLGASMLGVGSGMLGYETMGWPGAVAGVAAPMIGSVAKSAENRMAHNSIEGLAAGMTERSPLYQERLRNAPTSVDQDIPAMAAARAISTAPLQQQDDRMGYGVTPGYAKGGKVKKPTHEFLVNRLMNLAEKAKKAEKKVTAPILNMPDDVVTTALAKAQEAI